MAVLTSQIVFKTSVGEVESRRITIKDRTMDLSRVLRETQWLNPRVLAPMLNIGPPIAPGMIDAETVILTKATQDADVAVPDEENPASVTPPVGVWSNQPVTAAAYECLRERFRAAISDARRLDKMWMAKEGAEVYGTLTYEKLQIQALRRHSFEIGDALGACIGYRFGKQAKPMRDKSEPLRCCREPDDISRRVPDYFYLRQSVAVLRAWLADPDIYLNRIVDSEELLTQLKVLNDLELVPTPGCVPPVSAQVLNLEAFLNRVQDEVDDFFRHWLDTRDPKES